MSTEDTVPSSICRIVGLTSEQGKKRNGSAARVAPKNNFDKNSGDDTRHPVSIDGFPGPIAIKAVNIDITKAKTEVSVGVGRGTILDTTFKAALVCQGQIIDAAMVTGGAARSRGNLEAMERLFTLHQNRKHLQPGSILITLTDLNIARAMNRAALILKDNGTNDEASSSTREEI